MRRLVYSTSLSLDGYIDGGLLLASALASAGLINEYRLYYVPIFLGSGKAAFSQIQNRVRLKPVETHIFSSGTVLLRCAPVSP